MRIAKITPEGLRMYDLTEDIYTHDFELAKEHIRKFSEDLQYDVELKDFDTKGGLFNLFDHKVTGEEVNEFVSQVQDLFINQNTANIDIGFEFFEVYQALEALDKDYIQSILASVKAVEKTQEDLRIEQKKLQEIQHDLIEQQKQQQRTQQDLNTTIDFLVDTNAAVSDIRRNTGFGIKHIESYNLKLKIAYTLSAGAIALSFLQFILNMIGII